MVLKGLGGQLRNFNRKQNIVCETIFDIPLEFFVLDDMVGDWDVRRPPKEVVKKFWQDRISNREKEDGGRDH